MSIPPRSRRRPGDTIVEAARDIPSDLYTEQRTPRYRIAPSVRVRSSTDISTPVGTTTITLNDTIFDTHEFRRDNSGKLWVPITGYYFLWLGVQWAASTTTSRVLCLRIRHVDKAGTDNLVAHDVQVTTTTNLSVRHVMSTTWFMEKDTYFYGQAAVAGANTSIVAVNDGVSDWGTHVAATFLGVENARVYS